MTKEENVEAIRNYIEDQEYKHEFDVENSFARLGFTVDCKLKNVKIIMQGHPLGIIVYAIPSINVAKDYHSEMMKYITMANYGTVNGCFELDLDDGEIRYKTFVPTMNFKEINNDVIDEALTVAIVMIERYGDGIAALSFGFSDAETEIKRAEEVKED